MIRRVPWPNKRTCSPLYADKGSSDDVQRISMGTTATRRDGNVPDDNHLQRRVGNEARLQFMTIPLACPTSVYNLADSFKLQATATQQSRDW